eukprot:Colp12_sorted_trinity150504_noHs@1908
MASWVDITPDGGVRKRIVKEGKGAQPKKGETVEVHYIGTLEDGEEFDESRSTGYPFKFVVGKGKVIKGWDLVILTMSVGEQCVVEIKPEYGYGEEGSEPDIPGGATLTFDMELISIAGAAAAGGVLTAEQQRLAEVRAQREAAAAKREAEKKAKEDAAKLKAESAPAEKKGWQPKDKKKKK